MLKLVSSVFLGRGSLVSRSSLVYQWRRGLTQAASLSPTEELVGNSVIARPTSATGSGQQSSQRPLAETFFNKDATWREFQKHIRTPGGSTQNKLLSLLRLCGGPVIAESPAVKVKLAEDMWQMMIEKGYEPDVSVYNIMLRVYNNNDYKIVPSEFLERMKTSNVYPNMGTFSQLVDAYCRLGNVSGATKLIEYLKAIDMPISEPICASLVTGHARAGDLQAAESVLQRMKANGQIPHNVVYTRLLCAYAERGDIEAIERVFGQMRSERLFPSMGAYTEVMNTLSKYGHGSLVTRILDLIKNKEWLSSDLRVLVCNCVSRGEVEAPRLLLKQLVKNNGVDRFVLAMYTLACIEQGQSLTDVLEDLKTDVSMIADPQSTLKFYHAVLNKLLFKHPPEVVVEEGRGLPPEAGALAPHPLGAAWSKSLLQLYDLMEQSDPHSVAVFYYFPLFARHCSDVNIEGFMATLKQFLMSSLPLHKPVDLYVSKMMSNAETSMKAYIDSKLDESEENRAIAMETALLGFLYYCSRGNFRDAHYLIKHFEGSDLLSRHSSAISVALSNGSLGSVDLTQHLVRLFKTLNSIPHPPDLTACLHQLSSTYRKHNLPASALAQFFSGLEQEKVDVVDVKCYLDLLPMLNSFDRTLFVKIFHKLQSYPLDESNYVHIFINAVRARRFGVAKVAYQNLSPATVERSDIQDRYLIYLSNIQPLIGDAVKLLDSMLADGRSPHYSVWHALIPRVAPVDLEMAEHLLQQMEACGQEPTQAIRHKLLECYTKQGNVEKAKAEFEMMVSKGWGSTGCTLMAEMWAELGDTEKLQEVIKMVEEKGPVSPAKKLYMKIRLIKAQLKSGDEDGALSKLKALELSDSLAATHTFYSIILAFVQSNCSVESVTACLKDALSPSVCNSLLFFAYVDCKDEEKAAAILKDTEALDSTLFGNLMSSANAADYLRLLMKCEYHLRNIKSAYLVKSGYVKLNDTDGIQELRKSLEEKSRTDWLWTVL